MTPPGGSGNRMGGEPPADDAGPDDEAAGSGDGDGKLAAMRSVWLSMREEEPSGRGMAELLAAARGKAEAMAPKPSRWQRWAAALRRPAVLALATVLVLVCGAVLLGRRVRDDGEVMQRQVSAPAPIARGAAGEPATMPTAPSSVTATGGGAATKAGAMAAGPAQDAAGDRGTTTSRSAAVSGAAVARDSAVSAGRAPAAAPGGVGTATAGTEREQILRGGVDRDDAGRAEDARPVAPAHAAPSREAPPTDPSLVSGLRSASAGRRSPLVQQCEAAARRGDCPAVRRLIAQISQTDPGYRARVAQDAAFARCLE